MLIQVIAVEYLRYLQFDKLVREQTLKTHRKRIGALVMFWLHREIESITNDDIVEYKQTFLQRGCKLSYIKAHILVIRSFLKFCQEQKLNVLNYKVIKVPKVPRQEVSYLTKEQVQKMLNAISNCLPRVSTQVKAIVHCLLTSGIRVTELTELNRDSINFATKTAEIIGKGGKKRIIVFGDEALEAIQAHLKSRIDQCEALFISHCSNVPGGNFTRLKADGVRHYLKKIGKELGFNITPHMLRRTAATNLHFNGMNTEMVRAFLGHENIATTSRYLGVNYEKLKEEHKKYMKY